MGSHILNLLIVQLNSHSTARKELIHTSSTENATEVQEDLKDLNDKCVLFWIAENWALNCSAKPIIELDIHYIGQPEISRLVDVTGICKWLLSSFCYWNYWLNSVSVQQQHCRCVHHKWMLSCTWVYLLTLFFLVSFDVVYFVSSQRYSILQWIHVFEFWPSHFWIELFHMLYCMYQIYGLSLVYKLWHGKKSS